MPFVYKLNKFSEEKKKKKKYLFLNEVTGKFKNLKKKDIKFTMLYTIFCFTCWNF